MPSALDLLNDPGKSAVDLLDTPDKPKSALDLFPETPVAPVTAVPEPEPLVTGPDLQNIAKDFYSQTWGFDIDNPPPYEGQLEPVTSKLKQLGSLAANPYDVVKGAGEFVSAIPAFIGSIGSFGSGIVKTMAGNTDWTMMDLYEAGLEEAHKTLEAGHRFITEPVGKVLEFPRQAGYDLTELIFDKEIERETGASELVGETIMAPYTFASTALKKVADKFENSPNVKGTLYFVADAAGFRAMHNMHGFAFADRVKAKAEPIVEKATRVAEAQEMVDGIPNEAIKAAQQRVLDVQKQQLELEAEALKKEVDATVGAKTDVAEAGRRVEEIKEFEEAYEAYEPELPSPDRKIIERTGEVEVGEVIKANGNNVRYDGKYELPTGDKYSVTIQDGPAKGATITVDSLKPIDIVEGVEKANERFTKKDKPIKKDVSYTSVKPELMEVFDKLDEIVPTQKVGSLKRKKKFKVRVHELTPGERAEVPPTWHDATFRYTMLKHLDGTLQHGAAGSYDTILSPGHAARGGQGMLQPGMTAYIIDLGPGNVRVINIYRAPDISVAGPAGKKALPEPVTEVDMQTGTKEPPRMSTEESPFRQPREVTQTKSELYEENAEMVESNMETYAGKLINDVNRWLDGEEVNIADVRNKLSIAAGRGRFSPEFAKSVSEAASWARKAERPGVKLSSGIDPTDVSKVVQLIPKALREFRRDLGKDIEKRALQTMQRMERYKDWEFNRGDKIKSNTTGRIYEVTGRSWDRKNDTPLYTYKSADEAGVFYAESAHEGFTKIVEGPNVVKLYSGIPLDKAAKEVVKGARALAAYTKKARGVKSFKPVQAAQMLREEFNRAFVDRSGNIRNELLDVLGDEGYKVAQKMYLAKGASSVSARMMEQMRKEVYRGLTRHEKEVLDNVILADRMMDIGKYKTPKQFKFPEGLTPVEAAAYRELFPQIEKISPERAAKIDQAAKSYFEWMKVPLNDMLEAGLISEAEHAALSAHNYRRLKLVDVFDKRSVQKVGAKRRTVYDSGVEALQKGRDTDVFEPSSEVMALEVFNRAYGRILNNEANKGLMQTAREHPDNPFVRVKEKPEDHIPSGWNRVFAYEDGARKPMYLSPEMSKEWITNSPEMSYRMSQLLRYTSGSPVLRTFATGINWGFALANLPRDVMHTWFAARVFKDGKWEGVYSPHAPVFGLQIASDLSSVFLDAATKGKRYEQYIKEGGGMEFLVHQGRLFQRGRHINRPLDDFYNFMGYFGETSEIMTRLAIRDRVIKKRAREQGITVEQARKNKDITREATFAARDYMDFGQGGGIAKALDNAFPYLNASIQGTRGMFRAFKPGSGTAMASTWKLTQFASLVTGLYIASNARAPESMRDLKGNIDAQNNLIIPLGDEYGFEDEFGQTRYPYIKIPLDPGQKFFKTFFEASADKWLGNEVDVNAVVDSLKEQSPVGVTELPPTISGTLGYVTNKDFWLNEDIWRKTEPFKFPESREEFIPGRTPQAMIDIGQATGLSPERTRHAISELTTNGTVWSYLLGEGYDQLFGQLPKDQKEKHLAMVLAKMPVVKRFFGVTNPYSKHAQDVDVAQEEDVLQRWIQTRELDRLAEGYLYEDSVSRKEVFKYIDSFKDQATFERLDERFRFQEAIKGVPNRSLWLRMRGLSPEARARVYVEEFPTTGPSPEEWDKVEEAGGVFSDRFWEEVDRLQVE